MDIRKFWVDIEDKSGNRYGDGPLRARVFRVKKPLSESGDFAFDVLGSDPNIDALQIKRVAICRYLDASGATQTLGGGIVDKIIAQLDPTGLLIYQVSGNDLTRELFYRSVGSLKLESAGVGVTNGPDLIMAYAPAGWTINSGSTTAPVYLGFAGESVLAALIKCAENAGEHWRLGSGREIDWIGLPASFVSSGVRAVQHLNDAISAETLASLAVVMALNETHDSAEVLSRVIPIGAGIGGAATTLANATDPAPSGYTLDTVNNYLKQNAAEAAYGRIEKSIEFKDLGPLGATVTDAASASNALLQAAYQHLERFKAPAKFYDVAIWTNAVLEPGQTIQIIYRKLIDSAVVFDLNDEFIILTVEQTIDEQGLSTTKMMVATVDRKPATDADIMLDELQQSNNLQTNRQQILADDIVGLNVVIGSGTPGHVAQWDSGGSTLEDSTLIKSGAGLLTLAAAADYTLTIPDTGTAAVGAGTLSVSSTNNTATPTQTHAITSSSNPGAAASLLATNASGQLQLAQLGVGKTPTVPLDVVGNVTIASTAGPTLKLSSTDGSVNNGDVLVNMDFEQNDLQAVTKKIAARLQVQSPVTIASDITPGDMVFLTGPNAALDPVEWLRIKSTGATNFMSTPFTSHVFGVNKAAADFFDGSVLGAELITAGDFSTAVGWTTVNCTLDVSTGKGFMTATGTNYGVRQSIVTVANRLYKLTVNWYGTLGSGITNASHRVLLGTSAGGTQIATHIFPFANNALDASYTVYFVAQSATTWVQLLTTTASTISVWDNVVVKEVTGGNVISRGVFSGGGTNGIKINTLGGVIINDEGDAGGDFRVETDTETDMISTSATNNTLKLGGATNAVQVDKGGDTYFIGSGAGLPYGSCWGNEIGWAQASAAQNTWYIISDADMSDGKLNLFTHDGSGKLTATKAGTYLVNWSATMGVSGANKHCQMGISINGTVQNDGMQHCESFAANSETPMAGCAILTLTAAQYIEIALRTTDTGTPDLSVDHLNVTVVMVGS